MMGTNGVRFGEEREVDFNVDVDQLSTYVNQLEQKLNQVERFSSTANKKQKIVPKGSLKKGHQDALHEEAAASKRREALLQEFSEILRDITQHKWAGPFLEPVDVVGLGLDDYFEVIKKPMDFGTIKNKMYSNGGSGYKNVGEICADVRLIFKNAMKYNNDKDDVYRMAQSLLKRFEDKWLKLLPKVDEEERRRKEEGKAQRVMQIEQEAAHAKMVGDLSAELDAVNLHLEQLRDMVLRKCRKVTTKEKKMLVDAIPRLPPEAFHEALDIVSQDDPTFEPTREEVDLNLDKQSEATLLRLKIFVKDALLQQKSCDSLEKNNNSNVTKNQTINKRKREASDAPARTSKKKSFKPSN